MERTAQMLKALGDEARLQIVALLSRFDELCVCDVEGALEFSQSKASRHMRYLLGAGLVENRREGQWLYYRIARGLDPARKNLLAQVGRMLPARQVQQLERRMRAWLDRKASGTRCA